MSNLLASNLLVTPEQQGDKEGKVLSITPESAGWKYVGFDVYKLKEGQIVEKGNARSRNSYRSRIWSCKRPDET
ncbi:hypothetical protein GCM10020331_097350 [Ectobacillus funiculus]